jgi:RHS repeat-associated protein
MSGQYAVRLTLYNSGNQELAFDEASVTATNNEPPKVDAGPDRSIAVGGSVTILGTATDDWTALPNSNFQWQLLSGPGSFSFAQGPGATLTLTGLTTPGIYSFRLTVYDDESSGADDVVVRVLDPRGRTWTRNADFEEGHSVNVSYDEIPDQLVISPAQAEPAELTTLLSSGPYGKIFLVNIDAETGETRGCVAVGPSLLGTGPSFVMRGVTRTLAGETLCVGDIPTSNGSCPVIIRLGFVLGGTRDGEYLMPPFRYSTLLDRLPNSSGQIPDGRLHVSGGPDQIFQWNYSISDEFPDEAWEAGAAAAAEDETVTQFVVLREEGGLGPALASVHSITIDSEGFPWVAGPAALGDFVRLVKLDPQTLKVISTVTSLGPAPPGNFRVSPGSKCQILALEPHSMEQLGLGCAAGLLIHNLDPLFWEIYNVASGLQSFSSQLSLPHPGSGPPEPVVRFGFHPQSRTILCLNQDDPMNSTRLDPLGWEQLPFRLGVPYGTFYGGNLVQIGAEGDIWAAANAGIKTDETVALTRISSSGQYLGQVPTPCLGGMRSLGRDTRGRIWIAGYSTDSSPIQRLVRINPTLGPVQTASGKPVGQIDLMLDEPAAIQSPNWTILSQDPLTQRAHPTGVWTAVHDAGSATTWGIVTWNAVIVPGSSLKIEARTLGDYPAQPEDEGIWQTVSASGGSLNLAGRWIEVRVTFVPNSGGEPPVLNDLTVLPASASALAVPTFGRNAVDDDFSFLRVVDQQTKEYFVQSHTLEILANDRPMTLQIQEPLGQPRHGSAKVERVSGQSDRIIYTPEPRFFGEDRFVYSVRDDNGLLDRALVRVRINHAALPPAGVPAGNDDQWALLYGPQNLARECRPSVPQGRPPVASPDYSAIRGRSDVSETAELIVNVLANDYDPDSKQPVALVDDFPRRTLFGRVRRVGESLSYLPDVSSGGADQFTYTILNQEGRQASGSVTVFVAPVNPPQIDFTLQLAGSGTPVDSGTSIGQVANVVLKGRPQVGSVDASAFENDYFYGLATGQLFESLSGATSTAVPRILRVEFFDYDRKLGEGTGPDWSLDWTGIPAGVHSLKAVVTDALGLVASSQVKTLHVNRPGDKSNNQPPFAEIAGFGVGQTNAPPSTPSGKTDSGAGPGRPHFLKHGRPTLYTRINDRDAVSTSGGTPQLCYQVLLFRSDGQFVANVTPGNLTGGYKSVPWFGPSSQDTRDPDAPDVLDLTSFENGGYDLELRVNDGIDEAVSDRLPFVLCTGLKLGRFTFSEEDQVLNTCGIPLTIARTYDSSNPFDGDFGHGWTFVFNDLNVEFDETRVPATDALSGEPFSLRAGGGRDVTLTLPDGRRTTFCFKLDSEPGLVRGYRGTWVSEPGVTATLSTRSPGTGGEFGDNLLFALNNTPPLVYWHSGGVACPAENYDFPELYLTNQDQTVYTINREDLGEHDIWTDSFTHATVHAYGKARVTRIDRPNGEYFLIGPNAVEHHAPSGEKTRAFHFERGVGNRIVAVRDSEGQSASVAPLVKYEYDGLGNLVYVHKLLDREKRTYATTTYVYGKAAFPHYITEIRDPRGVAVARNEYYDNGKLWKIKDAEDRVTTFDYPTSGLTAGAVAKQLITHPEANSTEHQTDASGNVLVTVNRRADGTELGRTERTFDGQNNLTQETLRPSSSGPSLTTGYALTYDANRIVKRITTRPGNLVSGETFNPQGQPELEVDAAHYCAEWPAIAASFWTEYEYAQETHNPRKTYARPSSAYANPLNETVYSPSGPGSETYGLVSETYDALRNKTAHSYYTAAGFDGRYGDLQEVKQLASDGTPLASTVYKYDPATGNLKEEIRRRRQIPGNSSSDWTDFATTRYEYDARGRAVKTTDPLGGVATTTYNSAGQVATSTDRYGAATRYTYDLMGRLVQTEYPDRTIARSITRYAAYPGSAVLRQVIQEDRHSSSDPVSARTATRTIYDELGRPILNERLSSVNISFELDGEIGKTTFNSATGVPMTQTQTTYDYAGRVDMTADANGKWTKNEYDSRGRVWRTRAFVSSTGADTDDTITTIMDYDANGNQHWVLGPSQFELIKAKLIGLGDPAVNPSFIPTWRDRIWNDHRSRLTVNTYDEFNRLTRVDAPSRDNIGPSFTQSKYDLAGRKWLQVDADNHATAFVYDELGRLARVITDVNPGPSLTTPTSPVPSGWPAPDQRLADSTVTQYSYDELGNLIAQIDANSHTTSYDYDALGRRLKRTLPGTVRKPDLSEMTGEEQWTYDYTSPAQGPKVNKTRKRDFNGRFTLITHDVVGRIIERRPDGRESWAAPLPNGGDVPVSFTYTPSGQRATMTDASGQIRYAYDDQNRLRIVKKPEPQATLYYDYDAAGNITEISARRSYSFASPDDARFVQANLGPATARPAGVSMTYQYDGRNRLGQVFSAGTLATTYGYGPGGELRSAAHANGVITTYDYNARLQLRRVRSAAASLIANFDYDEAGEAPAPAITRATWTTERLLSPSGRRNRMVQSIGGASRTVDYGYDNLNRLSREDVAASSVVYDSASGYESGGYDPVGNRHSRTVTGTEFPGINGQTSLAYDPNDRADNDTDSSTPSTLFDANGNWTSYSGWSYGFDFEDRLIAATNGGTIILLVYDGDGNRVKKIVDASDAGNDLTTFYLVDDRNPTGYPQVLEEQPSMAGAAPAVTYLYGLDLVSQTRSGATSYFGYDALGSVRFLTGSRAETALVASTTPSNLRRDYSGWVGVRLQVGSTPMQVSSLGRWVVSGNSGVHTVKLTAADGTDVAGASVSVNTAGAPAGQFAYVALNQSVLLAANTVYFLVSQETSGGDYWYDHTTTVTPTSAASFTGSAYRLNGVTTFAVTAVNNRSYVPVSLKYAEITDTYTYDAFGNLIASTGSTVNNYRYTGEQWDPDVGLYYLRARYYDTQFGRFWTMDTFEGQNEDPLSLHKFIYCAGNPVNGSDPSGHEFEMGSLMTVLGNFRSIASARGLAAALSGKDYSDYTQRHHLIPYQGEVSKHYDHDLVRQAGYSGKAAKEWLKSYPKNIVLLTGHIGKHTPLYNATVRKLMNDGLKVVKGKGKQAALAALDEVMQTLEEGISNGSIRPYGDDHDVVIP